MKDGYSGVILGIVIGVLACYCFMHRDGYVEPMVIRFNKWHKTVVEVPVPTYRPDPAKPPVPIPDTAQWGNVPVEPFRYEVDQPFSVNDSNFVMPLVLSGEAKWLKKLDIDAPYAQFTYEVKAQYKVDWKWTAAAFVLGALAMRGVDAVLD